MADRVPEARLGSRFVREPLLHFIVLGALLFALDAWRSSARDDPRTLVVTPAVRATLSRSFEQREGRAPTAAELGAAIGEWAKGEALYREALRLGLDQGDPVVRDRLVQKMRGVEESSVVVRQPTDAELETWLREHRQRYESPLRFDFEHHFVAQSHADADARAERVLKALRAEEGVEKLTDAFYAGSRHERRSVPYLERTFGKGFANALTRTPTGEWALLRSDHGLHAVRLKQRAGGEPPTVKALRGVLTRDWQAAERQRRVDERLDALARTYRVVEP